MKPITVVTSKAVPLPLNDVDTDMIIPAQFLTSVSKDGYGENLFRRLKEEDSTFPTNDPKYKGAQIFIGGKNFGCGSSREHAVWAFVGAGFRVVIAKSFADIFYSNGAKNGLLLITLPEPVVDALLENAKSGNYEITADLKAKTVTLPNGEVHSFSFDPFRQHCLLEGLDDFDYILAAKKEIEDYRVSVEEKGFV